jgi:hypothetical protein
MWRGYGSNGHGAAIIFDTAKFNTKEEGPLMLAQVKYGSHEERLSWFDTIFSTFADILSKNQIPDDKIYLAASALFGRIKRFSLFTKHIGFEEEREWRAVYLKENDENGIFESMLGYRNGPRGVEPILKLKVDEIGEPNNVNRLDDIISTILLGPSTSSPLAYRSVERMLELLGKENLKDRLISSTIPLRPLDN